MKTLHQVCLHSQNEIDSSSSMSLKSTLTISYIEQVSHIKS